MTFSTLFLNNTWHELAQTLGDLLAQITELRESNKVYDILLGPVASALAPAHVAVEYLEINGSTFLETGLPAARDALCEYILAASPNSIYCFNKTSLLIYAIDTYFVWFGIRYVWERKDIALGYLIVKFYSLAPTLLVLSPFTRFSFWFIGFGLMAIEVPVALYLICSWGYGIEWHSGPSFYSRWNKHYHYRYATSNRQITVELSCHVYILSKFLILWDYFCASSPIKRLRDSNLPLPSSANLTPDLVYINSLLEQDSAANLRYGILFILALSSLGVYSIILAGWSSNSKYAFIGALRSAAQMISYEVAISLILLPIIILAGSLNLTMVTHVQSITSWFIWPLFPVSLVFLVAMLAETNRTPFDLPEAEAELVAGYNVDYSSLPFAMFFLGEYCNMILISVLYCILFLGGGLNDIDAISALVLALKAAVIWVFFVLVRATLPRYRYDQLMDIGWKVFMPLAGGFLVFGFGLLVFFDALPITSELPVAQLERFAAVTPGSSPVIFQN